ncbi:MAG TPA: beta-N-acetylhexosaminidase [Burkholderiales bacterium]|nr:beta-N-acetylhexosaminidase [Burkholderiales bacterium]
MGNFDRRKHFARWKSLCLGRRFGFAWLTRVRSWRSGRQPAWHRQFRGRLRGLRACRCSYKLHWLNWGPLGAHPAPPARIERNALVTLINGRNLTAPRRARLRQPLGPAIIDVAGTALSDEDRERLRHPAAGGVILFSRNFESCEQLAALTGEIARLRDPELPICVDQEGGRVQRFREGFSAIPPMRELGRQWDRDRSAARETARAIAYVVGAELAAHGVDFSFAPVLDLDYGGSSVIGDRALHFDPTAVGALGACIVQGFADAGMGAVGKHFPGHGYAEADSHVAVPRDDRKLAEIQRKDLVPFRMAIEAGLAAVMPAHVIYTQVDGEPAGYSRFWLQEVLRGKLRFQGLIFSDDLSLEGASTAGGVAERARAALAAGCDMVLLCNDPAGQALLLDSLKETRLANPQRVERMRKKGGRDLRKSVAYRESQEKLRNIG